MEKTGTENPDILNECLEAVMRGETPESCLTRCHQEAQELGPLLETVKTAREACRVAPRPEFRARARYEYHRAVADACARRQRQSFRWSWRWATALPLAATLILLSSAGVMAASTRSLPGEPLYGVKLSLEEIQLKLTPSAEGKIAVYAGLADRRVSELITLTEAGKSTLAGETSLRLESTLGKITEAIEVPGPESNAAFVPLQPAAGSAMPPAEKTRVFDTTSGQEAYKATVDPALLKVLKDYAARNKDRLQIVLERVPDNTQVILHHAIGSYETILNAAPAPE